MLFGVRNEAGFLPVATHKKFPYDASPEAAGLFRQGGRYPAWITWLELSNVDWRRQHDCLNRRVEVYSAEPDGTLSLAGYGGEYHFRLAFPGSTATPAIGTRWDDGTYV